MPPGEITKLKDAIRATHGCESLHVESVPMKEVFEGQIAWEGTVEVFDLIGHPKAKRAYAWTYREGDQNKTIAVLAFPQSILRNQPLKWQSQAKHGQMKALTRMVRLDQDPRCQRVVRRHEKAS